MSLDLTADEREYLLELLRTERGRLRSEVHHTEARDYKEALKAREQMLSTLIERLEAAAGQPA